MSTSTSALTVASSTWPLISAVVVGLGILGGALFYVWPKAKEQDHPQRVESAPVAATPQSIDPVAPTAEEPPAVPAVTPPAAEPMLPSASGFRPKDRLASEVALLVRATSDLRAGRPTEALKSLDEYRHKFPKGTLRDEQRAATAQALCALGRFDEARASLTELPKHSLLALRAKQFCDSGSMP